jgi:hypothetical protein
MCYEELAHAARRHRLQPDGYAKETRSIMPVSFKIRLASRRSGVEHMTVPFALCVNRLNDALHRLQI